MDSVAAEQRIRPHVRETPLAHSRSLSDATGARVYLKLEHLQETGAFKLRGAANKLLSLPREEAARGLVTASSGNHALAVATMAGKLGFPVEIFVSEQLHPVKRTLMERVAGLVRETFFIPDARVGWLTTAVPEAMRIVRTEGIVAIYTSSPPYTTALIGREVKRRTQLPWIAGFRDPWTGFLSAPDRWFIPDAIDRWLEKRVFTEADMIDGAWQGIIDDYGTKFPGANIHKCVHLPNGFDPDDYPQVDRAPNERFTTTYTGSMYGKRNPETFLRAVEAGAPR